MNNIPKKAPEGCHLGNQIKPPPDQPLDKQKKDAFESTLDKVIYFHYVPGGV